MNAMILEGQSPIEKLPLQHIDLEEPWPSAGEVRIKVTACGVCRTDLHIAEGDLGPKGFPRIPGHQVVGRVDVVGPQCKRYRVGDRVGIAWLRHTCGSCTFCQRENENLCENSRYTGYTDNGGFAQYAVVPENYAYSIPENIPDLEAAPLLCAGIMGYRALKKTEIRPGDNLGLFGFGSSAHITLQVAKARGCRVFVVTRGDAHRRLAREMGADWVGDRALDLPRKLDGIILFAPAGELVPVALASLKKGGTLAVAGICLTDIPPLHYETHLFYEKNICSVTSNTRQDGEDFFKEISRLPILPKLKVYSLRQANQALIDIKNDSVQGSAVLQISQ